MKIQKSGNFIEKSERLIDNVNRVINSNITENLLIILVHNSNKISTQKIKTCDN